MPMNATLRFRTPLANGVPHGPGPDRSHDRDSPLASEGVVAAQSRVLGK